MRRRSLTTVCLLAWLMWSPARPVAQVSSAAERQAFTARLTGAERLTDEDLAQLIEEAGRAVGDRGVYVHERGLSRRVTDAERGGVLTMLYGYLPVADAGYKLLDGVAVRGIRAPATTPTAEVDASQFLWIDVDTRLPTRYELTFSMPGMGEGFVDLSYDP